MARDFEKVIPLACATGGLEIYVAGQSSKYACELLVTFSKFSAIEALRWASVVGHAFGLDESTTQAVQNALQHAIFMGLVGFTFGTAIAHTIGVQVEALEAITGIGYCSGLPNPLESTDTKVDLANNRTGAAIGAALIGNSTITYGNISDRVIDQHADLWYSTEGCTGDMRQLGWLLG